MHPEDENHERFSRAGLLADRAGASTLEPPQVSALYLGQQQHRGQPQHLSQPERLGQSQDLGRPQHLGQPQHRAQPQDLGQPQHLGQPEPRLVRDPLPAQPVGQHSIRLARTWPQRSGGILIAAAMVAAAIWYIPSVLGDNRQLLTGTVSSSGVITLNFSSAGAIAAINVKPNETVHKGQVLAREYAPESASVVIADKAAIAADDAKIAQVKAVEAADPANAQVDTAQLLAAQAQLDLDQAQLSTDRTKIATTEIIAPSAGVIVAANGLLGQTVTASGIRDYVTDSQEQSAAEGPAFSLLPEGPQTVHRISASASAVPMFALRTSDDWQVIVLVPESAVARVRAGERVGISVPADHIKDVPGLVNAVQNTPTPTSAGVFYQAVVNVTGHAAIVPLNGMAADIEFGS